MTAVPTPSQASSPTATQAEVRSGLVETSNGHSGLDHPRRGFAVGAVLAAMAMVVVDGGLSNVALPTLAVSLHVAPSDAILVMTAYQVAVVMTLLPSAALGERFGYRRVFAIGVAIFSTASLASALAPSFPWLVVSRFAQGLGGAAILSLGVALLRFSVSDARLGAAVGWNALTVALSAAAGPAIGALVISIADWHWLYVANVPAGIAVLAACRALPFIQKHPGKLDIASGLLNCAFFGLVVIAADIAIGAPIVAAGLALSGITALVALWMREKPKQRPLIPIDLLRSPSFAVSIVASVSCFTGQAAGLIALPFFLQHELNQAPAIAGLYLTVWPLSVAFTAPIAGRLARRVPHEWICAMGATLLAVGLAAITVWPLKDDPRPLAVLMSVCGAGFGLFQVANNRNMFLAAPPARSAAAGGMQGTARLMGQTAGALIVAQLFSLSSIADAPQTALAVGAAFTLMAGLVSLSRIASR